MPPITPPVAGTTHHLVLKYGPPSAPSYQGLMLPDGDLKKYIVQPYTPFAPQSRQGNATIQDFSVATVWELNADFSGGAGHTRERPVSSGLYAFAQGNNVTGGLGTTLFTAQKGKLLPAPAHADANVGGAISGNIKQFIEFKSRLYGLNDQNPGIIYQWSADGLVPTAVQTLNSGTGATVGVQLFTDGNLLYCTRGAGNKVRTFDGASTWADWTDEADFLCVREGGVICRFLGAVFDPKGTEGYSAATIGWSGTNATNMTFLRGAVVIGKPEGLWTWTQGRIEEKFPCHAAVDTINFSKMAAHNNLLWFNFKNRLFFTDLRTMSEIYPEDRGGFHAINCLVGTGGPLLIGAKWYPIDASAAFQGPRSVTNPASDITDDASLGNVAWANPQNAGASDNLYATAALSPGQSSHYLKALDFGFSIPSAAVITGVMAEVERKQSGVQATDLIVKLVKGGVISGNNKAFGRDNPWPTNDAYAAYGGVNDLWGLTLTPADVNASNFGLVVAGEIPDIASNVLSVDHIRITIYYTTNPNPQNALFTLDSAQDAGLNPLWTDANGSNPMYAAYATSAPDATASRVYTCSDHANWKVRCIDLDTRFLPKTYDTNASNVSYIDLVEFSAGFASVKKWWYECVVNASNPNLSTFAKVFYSIDGATFTQTQDQTGAAVEHMLSARSMGSFFPLDTVGTYNQIRLFLRTTAAAGAASITTVTLRGDVIVKPRYQFQFPVDCSETVLPLQGVAENGNAIWQNLKTASQQGYPCKLQDPEGNWHLVLFQTSPYFSAVDYRVPSGGGKFIPYGIVTAVFEEIDALASDGSFSAWSAG